jgi:hypothetical protein
MKVTILHVAYAHARVADDNSGGAEQVLRWLDQASVRAGICSLVIAREGSCVAGQLIPVPKTDGPLEEWQAWGCKGSVRLFTPTGCITSGANLRTGIITTCSRPGDIGLFDAT